MGMIHRFTHTVDGVLYHIVAVSVSDYLKRTYRIGYSGPDETSHRIGTVAVPEGQRIDLAVKERFVKHLTGVE